MADDSWAHERRVYQQFGELIEDRALGAPASTPSQADPTMVNDANNPAIATRRQREACCWLIAGAPDGANVTIRGPHQQDRSFRVNRRLPSCRTAATWLVAVGAAADEASFQEPGWPPAARPSAPNAPQQISVSQTAPEAIAPNGPC